MECDYTECWRVIQCKHREMAEYCIIYKQLKLEVMPKKEQGKIAEESNSQNSLISFV
jgi:hypothetical protein